MLKRTRDLVVTKTAQEVKWWLNNRLEKFKDLGHKSMAINPFMAPALMALHSYDSFDELAELLLGGHFMAGHSTGFGKLVDEKILPNVFGTMKLDKARRKQAPYNSVLFDEIDHVVGSGNDVEYLSLKSSRWTIQLTMAMHLNSSFAKLIQERERGSFQFKRLVVGVIYGKAEDMTDKYRIIQGVTTGAAHDVVDIKEHVDVVTGRSLLTWLNAGEDKTQDWVMDGVLAAIEQSKTALADAKHYLDEYKEAFSRGFQKYISDGKVDWHAVVREING